MTAAADDAAGARREPTAAARPMFPLQHPVLPQMLVPLRVFEPRYLAMFDALRVGAGEGGGAPGFGMVMIARGREVGGGDVRTDVGAWAQLARGEAHPDGTLSVLAVAVAVVHVERWVADSPYPQAEIRIEPLHEADLRPADRTTGELFERVMRQAAELGDRAAADDDDRQRWSALSVWQAAAISPLGAHDRHRLLGSSPGNRWAVFEALLEGLDETQHFRLGR